jgi:hypothetical protein
MVYISELCLARGARGDAEVLALWREAMKPRVGRKAATESVDNINAIKTEKGTSRAYTVSRLKSQRPDLEPMGNTQKFSGGKDANYLAARLKRDHPEASEKEFNAALGRCVAVATHVRDKRDGTFEQARNAFFKGEELAGLGAEQLLNRPRT